MLLRIGPGSTGYNRTVFACYSSWWHLHFMYSSNGNRTYRIRPIHLLFYSKRALISSNFEFFFKLFCLQNLCSFLCTLEKKRTMDGHTMCCTFSPRCFFPIHSGKPGGYSGKPGCYSGKPGCYSGKPRVQSGSPELTPKNPSLHRNVRS